MDEDEEITSPPSSPPTGRISVTVAAAPPSHTLTLALPIQPKASGSGGGREDCWSDSATEVLIGAWGERYLELSRGNLKQKHWKDVADIVCSREDYTKTPKTDIQCKNRIDTVKKKYKAEKAKIVAGAGPSKWRFFDKLDELIVPTGKTTSNSPITDASNMHHRVPVAIPVGFRSSSERLQQLQQKANLKRPFDDESEPENSGDSSDGLPPESNKRPKTKRETINISWVDCMKELTQAIYNFGESFERAETAMLQQLVEMEKQRMKFAKDLELQRMQYLMKTQLELSQLKSMRPENNHNQVMSNNHNNDSDGSN